MLKQTIQEPLEEAATGCIVWMHGLGADAADMQGLVAQMPIAELTLRHVFLDAPVKPVTINGGMAMPAWYDITGFSIADREDSEGINQSRQAIDAIIDAQIESGLSSERIFLAGFSQGGAMALHTALHRPHALAGVIALSGYLPLRNESHATLSPQTPFFIANGRLDEVVLPAWTLASIEWLKAHGYKTLEAFDYPMGHTICHEEVGDLSRWLTEKVKGWGK